MESDNSQLGKVIFSLEKEKAPLWSVMIPAYNCEAFLRETLESVLQQDPGPEYMQIEVVDDFSQSMQMEQIVAEVGRGRVGYYQQVQNVGHTRNFNTCIARAKGELVHILHGDDRVRVGFYARMELLFRQHPQIGAAYCRFIQMQEDGQWTLLGVIEEQQSGLLQNSLIRMAQNQIVQPPAMVVKREVYEKLGGYNQQLRYGEDWEMWVRIAASYPVAYEPQPLAEYRNRSNSITGLFSRTGEDIRCTLQVIKYINRYLPEEHRRTVENNARRSFAMYHRWLAIQYYGKYDYQATKNQLKGVVSLYRHPHFLLSICKLFLLNELRHTRLMGISKIVPTSKRVRTQPSS